MMTDCLIRQHKPFRDLGVAQPLSHEVRGPRAHAGEPSWILVGCRSRPTRHAASPAPVLPMRVSPSASRFVSCPRTTQPQGRMPRYMVQRTFPEGLQIPSRRAAHVSAGKRTTFCVYDAPTSGRFAPRLHAIQLLVDRVTQVQVPDPYIDIQA